jgi:predicted AlkP superfamily phosphohydrolase/phosphomutase
MERTVLVGLDGATFSVLDPLMADGVMPFLSSMASRGARCELTSTRPHVSPAAWTSIATGLNPGNHGVFDFIRSHDRDDEVYFTLYDSRDVDGDTIWTLASRRGFRVTLLNYMLTFPPPQLNGYLVPGLVSWRHLRRGTRPASLFDTITSLFGPAYKEMAWDFDLEKKVLRGIGPDEYETWVRYHIRRERLWFELVRHLMSVDPCDITAIVFDGVDKIQHACWHLIDPELLPDRPDEAERRVRDLCLEYFREVDGYLAEIAGIAGRDARMFVVSDHGFGPTREVFRVNSWLHERGYLEWAPAAVGDDVATQRSMARRLDSNFALLDWERTIAYTPTPSGNGVVLRSAGAERDLGGRYEAVRAELIDGLRQVPSPITGQPVVRRVLTREEAFRGRRMHDAPDLYLELADHGFVSIRNLEPTVDVRPQPTGTHRPNGIFVGAGPGIRSGTTVDDLSAVDIAPLLLRSLGTTVPEGLDGRCPSELFDPAWLAHSPVVAEEAGTTVLEPEFDDVRPDPEGDAMILRRLADLGYIE